QVVGGGEEQLAIDHVLGDFFVKVLFDAAFHGDQVGHPIGEEHHGGQYAGGHADGQIVRGHGEDHGNEHDSGFALGHYPQGGGLDAVPVEGGDGYEDHHRDQGGHRDNRHEIAEHHDQNQQEGTS